MWRYNKEFGFIVITNIKNMSLLKITKKWDMLPIASSYL